MLSSPHHDPRLHAVSDDLEGSHGRPANDALIGAQAQVHESGPLELDDFRSPPTGIVEGERWLGALGRAMPLPVLLTRVDRCVFAWNEDAARLLSIRPGVGANPDLLTLFPPELNEALTQLFARLASGEINDGNETYTAPSIRWQITARLFRLPQDETRILVTVRELQEQRVDPNERVQMEQRLQDAQRLEAVGQLAAGVAHEINTPIQFIGDSIHFINEAFTEIRPVLEAAVGVVQASDAGDLAAYREQLGQAVDAADLEYSMEELGPAISRSREGVSRVAEIVRAMRSFSGKDRGEFAMIDITQIIRDTLIVARNTYKYVADVKLDLADIPAIECSSPEISQVLLNLVVNAAHAIEDKLGKSVDNGARGWIYIRTQREGNLLHLEIRDTGGGIPSEVLNRIFEPFFSTKEVGRGTGLGLSISRHIIVERHQGELQVQTEPGVGTCFTIILPLRQRRRVSISPTGGSGDESKMVG